MRRECLIASLLGVVLAALSAGSLRAQPAAVPTDGRTCFCLRHRSGQSLAGCVGEKAPNDFYATATCWDEERQQTRPPVTVDSSWTVMPAGEGSCAPCDRRPRRTGPEVPREGPRP